MPRIYEVVKAKPNEVRCLDEPDKAVYYIAPVGYPWIPVFGTYTTKRSEALKMAVNYSGLDNAEQLRKAIAMIKRKMR